MGIVTEISDAIKTVAQIAVKPLLAIAFGSGAILYAPVGVWNHEVNQR